MDELAVVSVAVSVTFEDDTIPEDDPQAIEERAALMTGAYSDSLGFDGAADYVEGFLNRSAAARRRLVGRARRRVEESVGPAWVFQADSAIPHSVLVQHWPTANASSDADAIDAMQVWGQAKADEIVAAAVSGAFFAEVAEAAAEQLAASPNGTENGTSDSFAGFSSEQAADSYNVTVLQVESLAEVVTEAPTASPSTAPTRVPSALPIGTPSIPPSEAPSSTAPPTDLLSASPTAAPSEDTVCADERWAPFSGRCWRSVSVPSATNWLTADALCSAADPAASLAFPRNAVENDYIRRECAGEHCFLGLTDRQVEGYWFSDRMGWLARGKYENFAAGYPRDISNNGEEYNCLELDVESGEWIDLSCTVLRATAALCMLDAVSASPTSMPSLSIEPSALPTMTVSPTASLAPTGSGDACGAYELTDLSAARLERALADCGVVSTTSLASGANITFDAPVRIPAGTQLTVAGGTLRRRDGGDTLFSVDGVLELADAVIVDEDGGAAGDESAAVVVESGGLLRASGVTFASASGSAVSVRPGYDAVSIEACHFLGVTGKKGPAIHVDVSDGTTGPGGRRRGLLEVGVDDAASIEAADIQLSNSVFNGSSASEAGGAILISGGVHVGIRNCTFVNNYATYYGGAVAADEGAVVYVYDSLFEGNYGNNGGALYGDDALFDIRNTRLQHHGVFQSNESADPNLEISNGGAVYFERGIGLFDGCVFEGNAVLFNGGGVHFQQQSIGRFRNTTFRGNEGLYGGATSYFNNVYESTFDDCHFEDNHSRDDGVGGASYFYDALTTYRRCTFLQNGADFWGGAVYFEINGYGHFSDCAFTGNTANEAGGAIGSSQQLGSLANCSFSGNEALRGGALYVDYAEGFEVAACSFEDNVARASYDGGGAISVTYGTMNVDASSFTNNTAEYSNGGALYLGAGTKLNISRTAIADNAAALFGGAIFSEPETNILIVSSTVLRNEAKGRSGGGLLAGSDVRLTLRDSLVEGNIARGGDGGGLFVGYRSEALLEGAVVSGNEASGRGGGAFVELLAKLDAVGAVLGPGNAAATDGGAVYTAGDTRLESGRVLSSQAVGNGGGVAIGSGSFAAEGMSFTGNTAQGNGGGVHASGAVDLTLKSVVLDANGAEGAASLGGGLYVGPLPSSDLRNLTVLGNIAALGAGVALVGSAPVPQNLALDPGSGGCYDPDLPVSDLCVQLSMVDSAGDGWTQKTGVVIPEEDECRDVVFSLTPMDPAPDGATELETTLAFGSQGFTSSCLTANLRYRLSVSAASGRSDKAEDCGGDEVSWNLTTTLGDLIASGGSNYTMELTADELRDPDYGTCSTAYGFRQWVYGVSRTLKDSSFRGNDASESGGNIYVSDVALTLERTTLAVSGAADATSAAGGQGLATDGVSEVTFVDCATVQGVSHVSAGGSLIFSGDANVSIGTSALEVEVFQGGDIQLPKLLHCPPGFTLTAALPSFSNRSLGSSWQLDCSACSSANDSSTCSGGCPAECRDCTSCTSATSTSMKVSQVALGCASCEAGRYLPSGGTLETRPGHGSSEDDFVISNNECLECPAGTYTNGSSGSSACLTCPEGYYCPRGSSSAVPCGGVALFCPEGSPEPLQSSAGFYTTPDDEASRPHRTGQAACPAGYRCVGGERTSCEDGETFADAPLASSCVACQTCVAGFAPVRQCNTTHDTVCTACAEGRYSSATDSTCRLCPPGTFCSAAAPSALECDPGKYQPSSGRGDCLSCAIGYYQDAKNGTSCKKCPAHATTLTDGAFALDSCKCLYGFEQAGTDGADTFDCVCTRGQYLDEGALTAADAFISGNASLAVGNDEAGLMYADVCVSCGDGTSCGAAGTFLASLPVDAGYYRARPGSPVIERCPNTRACSGGAQTGDAQCREGHEGPFCDVCSDGWYSNSATSSCSKCNSGDVVWGALGVLLFLVVVVALVTYFFYLGVEKKKKEREEAKRRAEAPAGDEGKAESKEGAREKRASWEFTVETVMFAQEAALALEGTTLSTSSVQLVRSISSLKTKSKLIVSFLQIELILPLAFRLAMPPVFERFLTFFDILNFNFISGISGDCVLALDFYDGLLMTTMTPILILIVLFGLQKGFQYFDTVRYELFGEKLSYLMLLVTFMVLPSATTVSLNTFVCERLDTHDPPGIDSGDDAFLASDYSIKCDTSEHKAYSIYAGIMIFLYPIGIPLLYLWLLLRRPRATGLSVPQIFDKLRSENPSSGRGDKRQAAGADDGDSRPQTVFSRAQNALLRACNVTLDRKTSFTPLQRSAAAVQLRGVLFLLESYHAQLWWYECFESLRRLCLTGLPILFPRGTVGQNVTGLLMCTAFMLTVFVLNPYQQHGDNRLAKGCQLAIFLILLYGLAENATATISDKDERNIGILLVVMNVLILLAVLKPLYHTAVRLYHDDKRRRAGISDVPRGKPVIEAGREPEHRETALLSPLSAVIAQVNRKGGGRRRGSDQESTDAGELPDVYESKAESEVPVVDGHAQELNVQFLRALSRSSDTSSGSPRQPPSRRTA